MPKYIFSLGLIPVQEFIAEARRSRDLRAGSAILSWLTSRALLELIDQHQAKLIIPHQDSIEPFRGKEFSEILRTVEYSLPNRASGSIDADSVELAKSAFEQLQENCLTPAWGQIFEEAFKDNPILRVPADAKTKAALHKIFAHPPTCPIQLLWIVEAAADKDISAAALAEIKNCFDDIKRTRPLKPWLEGKAIGKCAQCGKREALSPVDKFNEWRDWQELLKSQRWVEKGIWFNSSEQLCLICLTKRFTAYLDKSNRRFPSTSEIATREWRSQISVKENLSPGLKTIEAKLDLLRKTQFDDPESLFYRRSIQKLSAAEKNEPLIKNILPDIADLKSAITAGMKPEPSNYLAVMMFDGDNMGKKITTDGDLPRQLMKFSKALITKYHRENAEKSAEPFYIGGDEGLILAPIETVLETALEIKNIFQQAVAGKTTLSMGVTIFDRQRPLGGAIHLAQLALKKSKAVEIDGEKKDALTITVQTASGNEFSATARWGRSWERVANALKLIQGTDGDRKLSMGWAYEVENFLQSLPSDAWGRPDFQTAATQEVKRITLRKLTVRHGAPQEKKACRVETWEKYLSGNEWFRDAGANFAETTSNQLHLIAFLARESAYPTEYTEEKIEENER